MATEKKKKSTNGDTAAQPTQKWPDGPKPTHYSPEWMEYFRHLIHERRKEIMHEIGYLRESSMEQTSDTYSGDSSTYSYHMADQGTDAQEREKAFLFASREGKMLTLLDQAEERMSGGTYGYCMDTNEPIEFRRLEAIPHAKLCIEAKRRLEEAKNNAE